MSGAACCAVLGPCWPLLLLPPGLLSSDDICWEGGRESGRRRSKPGPAPGCRSGWQQRSALIHWPLNVPAAGEALLHFVHQQKVFLIGLMFKHAEERMHDALLVRRGAQGCLQLQPLAPLQQHLRASGCSRSHISLLRWPAGCITPAPCFGLPDSHAPAPVHAQWRTVSNQPPPFPHLQRVMLGSTVVMLSLRPACPRTYALLADAWLTLNESQQALLLGEQGLAAVQAACSRCGPPWPF